jgi:large subunit ribosomal protein L16
VVERYGSTSIQTAQSPEWWIANVKPGRVMFEISGVTEAIATEAMRLAIHKLPMKCRVVKREEA